MLETLASEIPVLSSLNPDLELTLPAPVAHPDDPAHQTAGIGLVVEGLDLATLTPAAAAELRQLLYVHKLAVLREQEPDEEQYLAFARVLGRPEPYWQDHYHHPLHPEIFVSANTLLDGEKVGVSGTGRFWHSDYSFMPEPYSFTMIRPVILPSNRRTKYVDMVRVFDRLPPHLRRVAEGRRCFHEATNYYKIQPWDRDKSIAELVEEFREACPGTWHPMVIEHPVNGTRALFVSRGFTTKVEGLSHEESEAYLAELFEFVERPEHVFTHVWAPGDLILWDNRGLIHTAGTLPDGQDNISFRISGYDKLPFYVGHREE